MAPAHLWQDCRVGCGQLVYKRTVLLHVQDSHVQGRKAEEGQQVAIVRLPVLGLLDDVVDARDN